MRQTIDSAAKYFIDVFAGCGGLSLGLANAGWTGKFAVEKHPDAFNTLRHNLVDSKQHSHFSWPRWLPLQNYDIKILNEDYKERLKNFQSIKLVASGPPCQGFSLAGNRKANDHRNLLLNDYIEFVRIVRPQYLILENVKGITSTRKQGARGRPYASLTYADLLNEGLRDLGYAVYSRIFEAFNYGVPQRRPRFILIGISADRLELLGSKQSSFDPFDGLETLREKFLTSKQLPMNGRVGPKEALSDLETVHRELIECFDSANFKQVKYDYSVRLTNYQTLLRKGLKNTAPNSLRLVNHRPHIKQRFEKIIKYAEENNRKGISFSPQERNLLGIPKRSLAVLDPNNPSHTITTIPDDILHYQEPRVLTVRENARLQSFPDWFEFKGKYTTGQLRRRVECPRYTQVGNAVPPLLGEFLGLFISNIDERISGNLC